jgi:hypothetical protein
MLTIGMMEDKVEGKHNVDTQKSVGRMDKCLRVVFIERSEERELSYVPHSLVLGTLKIIIVTKIF